MTNKKIHTMASFFSGCGGFDLGFHKNKFKILFANDFWIPAAESFKANFPKVPFFEKPIQNIEKDELIKIVSKNSVDVFIGGPPCQCFTRLNNRHLIKLSELKKEDERRILSQEYIKKVKLLKPKIVLMENVRDMLVRKNQEGRLYKEIIEEEFKKIGYATFYKIIDMDKYGVPQKRRRVIFFATNVKKLIKKMKENMNYGFPKEENKVSIVKEALAQLKNQKNLKNHIITINEPETLLRIKHIPKGGYYEHLPDNLKTQKIRNGKKVIVKRYGSYFRRLNPDEPATTITNNYIIHPNKNRYLTNREKAIIHTFPLRFKFCGSENDVSQQIANAVPPLFAQKMAKRIKEILENDC